MSRIAALLIANRGEIACRIAATARRMGLRTVAVYSDADAEAPHLAACDMAVRLGPAPAAESYLDIAKVIAAARATGADAVHPGYGFLAESSRFAAACAEAGLTFVGPPAAVIEGLGLKGAAKEVAIKAGVPVLPGYNGAKQDDATLAREAKRIGFPLAVKAAAGGGGRGLRVVRGADELAGALESARREAKGAFGDERMILERWLDRPRHVEVQVVGDNHGNVVHLGARDCSVQRRHQKVVEEAPAPRLFPAELERRMGEAAVTIARAAGYRNAGTVEFLVEGDAFFFLEVNTRLQVEHPVTEEVNRVDLVEWQLKVADGEPLPLAQDAIQARGHAIEVRLCAEDPARGFLPQAGVIDHLVWPASGDGVRIDSGIRQGSKVGLDYDSLLAKLIAWGEDREAARLKLIAALDVLEIGGVATNARFLRAVLADADFARGGVTTPFLARKGDALIPQPQPAPAEVLAAAAVAWVEARGRDARSPWAMGRPWRLNAPARETLGFRDGEAERTVVLTHEHAGYAAAIEGRTLAIAGVVRGERAIALAIDGVRRSFGAHRTAEGVTLFAAGEAHRLVFVDPLAGAEAAEAADGHLRAPMPGRIVKLHVGLGAAVARGQPLIVLEAMKMEHTILAPEAGHIERLPFAVGDLVEEGTELVVIAPEGA